MKSLWLLQNATTHNIWSLFFCCKFWWPAKKYTLLLKHSSWELEHFSLSTSPKEHHAGLQSVTSALLRISVDWFFFWLECLLGNSGYWLEVTFIFILGATGGHVIYYICEKRKFCFNSGYACMLSHVWLFANPWTVALQAPLSMGFSR